MFAFLVIALAAMALAIGSWLRPLPSTEASAPPAPIYTDQQVASAKANVCTAVEKIEHAVNLSDNERAAATTLRNLAWPRLPRSTSTSAIGIS